MRDTYNTINDFSEGAYKEKGSKFLAFAYPVETIDQVHVILAENKKKFYDARHVCYAYRLGWMSELFRFNDDGEPSGTAGKPIYGQLLSAEVTNILIVVIRYFGGTKLGVSGLINAYKEAAKEALFNNDIVEKVMTKDLFLTFDYPLLNEVMRVIKEENLPTGKQNFQLNCQLDLPIRLDDYERIKLRLLAIYGVEEQPEKNPN